MKTTIINMKKTGQKIIDLRKKSGISVKEIQNVFNFTNPTAIYKWQKGESLPTIDNLVILSRILNVKIDDILETE